MAQFQEIMEVIGRGASQAGLVIGRGAAQAGVFIGRKVAAGYRAIDPDVIRHIKQTPLLGYSLFVSRREEIDPGKADGHPPLIFVHGLGGNRGNFLPMAWYLKLVGRKRGYKIHFESGQSIDEMARALARFVRDVKSATGEKKVEMVGHSLGGVIARLAILEHGLAGCVQTLVTLGAPHSGTYPARYANTTIVRALRPDSELIVRMNAHPWPKNVRLVTFWSQNDMFVLPARSAAVEGAEQIEATPFTHYSYLIDPKSWFAVGKVLAPRALLEAGESVS